MRKTFIATAVLAALAASSSVMAEEAAAVAATPEHTFTANVGLASEYIYRGIGQTNRKPAIQGGFDYSHASGLYAGVWASNISWLSDASADVSAPIEIDIYGGYKNTFAGGDWNYDVGVLTYNYPMNKKNGVSVVNPDTTEVYGAIGWKWLTAKYSHVVSSHIFGWAAANTTSGDTRGSGYLELNAAYDLGDGWGVNGHVGHQKIKDFSDASYSDYKLGVTKDVGFGTVGVAYWNTNAKGNVGEPYRNAYNKDLGSGRVLVNFTKTF
ncbi:MAG TPA: TorF family putative porin [Azospira sp.]|nr:TorF family putative porin [Azospira sp.]